jgi:hypothetical protein
MVGYTHPTKGPAGRLPSNGIEECYLRLNHADLEATCWENVRDCDCMETIEIGAVELPAADAPPSREFSRFIRPVAEPQLSDFCQRLMTIRQAESTMMAAGLRPITVEGRRFRWRFDERLVIVPEGRSGPVVFVEWGWHDWLEPEGPGPEPRIVTPRFVAEAIAFALANGWQPEGDGDTLLKYNRSGFRVWRKGV